MSQGETAITLVHPSPIEPIHDTMQYYGTHMVRQVVKQQHPTISPSNMGITPCTTIVLPEGTVPYIPPSQSKTTHIEKTLTYSHSGVGIQSRSSSHRSWVFTINHYTDDDLKTIMNLPIRGDVKQSTKKRKHDRSLSNMNVCIRIIACVQVGEKMCTPHIQGALVMASPCTRSWLSRQLPRAFLEVMKLTWNKNRTYCLKKQLQIIRDIDVSQQGFRSDIEEFRDAISAGKTDLELMENGFLSQVAKFPRFLQFAREAYAKANHRKVYTKLEVVVRWGKAGVGKTRYVWEKHAESLYAWVDDSHGKVWFDGYNGEEVLLIDEFTPNMIPYNYLLHLLEGYKLRLPVKTRFSYANWKTVYITSNWHPKDWYPKEGYTHALQRRFTRIDHVV